MSGPKITRTITREDRIAIARMQIASAEQAFALWRVDAGNEDEDAIATEARFRKEIDRLREDLEKDAFVSVAARAEALALAANHDAERRRERSILLAARRAGEKRSLRFTARSILDRCKQAGVEVTAPEERVLRAIVDGDAAPDAETIVATLLSRITAKKEASADSARKAFLDTLGGEPVTSASDVLMHLRSLFADARVSLIDRHLAELRTLGETSQADSFSRRIEETLTETGGLCEGRASLVIDSVGTDVSAALKDARALAHLRRDVEQEVAVVAALQDVDVLQPLVAAARAAIQDGDTSAARKRLEELTAARETRQRARSAANARRVVLDGLRELGYDVREGMAYVLGERKRVVVRHSANRGQAVELLGAAEDGRLQARVVAVAGENRGGKSDKEVEDGWCGEFEQLKQKITRVGGEIMVEKSAPAGASPLKVVPNEWLDDEHHVRAAKEKRQS